MQKLASAPPTVLAALPLRKLHIGKMQLLC